MPTPRLIHPIPVYIRKADRKFTAKHDDNLREPIGQVRREQKPIRMIAQFKIKDTDNPSPVAGGVEEHSQGYCCFLTADLRAAGLEIDRGDRIVQLGDEPNDRAVDYYVTKFQWRGHYPEHKGPTLLKAFWEDRKPSRQRGDL